MQQKVLVASLLVALCILWQGSQVAEGAPVLDYLDDYGCIRGCACVKSPCFACCPGTGYPNNAARPPVFKNLKKRNPILSYAEWRKRVISNWE